MDNETISAYLTYILLFLTFALGAMALQQGRIYNMLNRAGLALLTVSSVLLGYHASNRDRKRILKRLK